MNRQTLISIGCGLALAAYAVFFLSGLASVPFHPDEATQIYTSADVNLLFENPSALLFADPPADLNRQHYRMIDAPLTRSAIGLLRIITGQPALVSDWNWSHTWDQNITNGALPSSSVLWIARLACALPVPLAICLFFLILKKYFHPLISLGFSLLLGFNPLVLLHTRRAMAEGWLFSLTIVLLWVIFTHPRGWKWWLSLAAIGLILQAKQTCAPILLASGAAMLWDAWQDGKWKGIICTGLGITTAVLIGFYLLNPVLWADPVGVFPKMITDRLAFSTAQTSDYARHESGLAMQSSGMRLAGVLAQSAFAPPAYYDVGNYSDNLSDQIIRYTHNPSNIFLSGWIWGTILLVGVLCGLAVSILRLIQKRMDPIDWRLWGITLALLVFFGGFISIGFQRYYILFIPVWLLWIAAIFKKTGQLGFPEKAK
jgi:4-amino-4-deoxy-L-arabinose transferase-like glycosyltransferase